ncbi:PQQ-binding-like beta-propeller repeat protein [Breznakiella homolactica]|uniref:PQQ-binding-like beta-propeller repeat protein n=1 Tax=Breznakiella homolactica TaxID=2798577 RepID=A0A7T8B9G5_9SPIR|nr:PQQ-binding-like beta-propeller repeat protein [Breznakiella homolactica]QQO07940.1 PQQ-binding-like beta-propeller repeat protein [Breznakiella homolactica]
MRFSIFFIGLVCLFFSAVYPPAAGAQEARAEPVWRQALGGAAIGVPAAQVESVAVVCDGGNLRCYSRGGSLLWNYFAGGRLSPYVSRSREGTSYIARTNGTLIAVNRSGRELWRVSLGSPLSGPVLTGWDGRIFVPLGNRTACYTAGGYRLWNSEFGSRIQSGLVPDGRGGFIVILESGSGGTPEIRRINQFGEALVHRTDTLPRAAVPVSTGENPGTADALAVVYPDGSVEIRTDAGETLPLLRISGTPAAAVSRGDSLAVAMTDGTAVLCSLREGTVLWTGETHISSRDSPGDISMLYDERGIYILSKYGAAGFSEDGRRLWIIRIQGAASPPAFSDEGLLYSGGGDWILYAYRLEERIRNVRQSIYGPAPEASYGLGNPPPSSHSGYYYRNEEEELKKNLGTIEDAVRRGSVGLLEPEYIAYLMEVAGSGTANPGSSRPEIHVRYRAEALRILSFLGSRETIPFLTRVFRREQDPTVKAAAADAIGRIGVDPDGIALGAFAEMVFPPGFISDERLLLSIVTSTAALCRFSGPPLSDAGVRLLVSLGTDDKPPAVRTRVQRELATLR